MDREAFEARLARQCFREIKYLGTSHKEIYKGVADLRRLVLPARHYSVYGALVQTSGVGKSRAVMEMSTLGVYICYCSLAGKYSSAYPPRSGALADKLASTSNERGMVLYLKAWLLILAEAMEKDVSPVDWKEMQLCEEGNKLADRVLERWDLLAAADDTQMEDAAQSAAARGPDDVNLSILIDAISRIHDRLPKPRFLKPCVIFVFDESRGLLKQNSDEPVSLSPFCQIRRALRVFFRYPAFFALMLDTSARMSNLLPRKSHEDSDRALRTGIDLLPPLYFLPNMTHHAPQPGLTLYEYADPMRWVRYGRPLWAARVHLEGDPHNVVQLAMQKLVVSLTGRVQEEDVDVMSGKMTESQAMAILSAAAGLEICPRSTLAELMAASHLNLVLRVSQDRSRLYVGLPSEPIVAEAAAFILAEDIVKQKALMHMEAACMAGYVTPGPRGEFVAKFIMVAAVWALKVEEEADWYLRLIPVGTFLKKLLVNGTADYETFEKLQVKCPENGFVFFNSYLAVRPPPNQALLRKCFVRGQAIMYRAENNLPGADMIIPVWTPKGMTCIVVSVKNLAQPGWLEKVSVDKVRCEFTEVEVAANLPVITIVMSLREPKMVGSSNWLLWEDVNASPGDLHVHITCNGIEHNYYYLTSEVKQLLRAVLLTVPDAVTGASREQKRWIEQMIPEQFETPGPRWA